MNKEPLATPKVRNDVKLRKFVQRETVITNRRMADVFSAKRKDVIAMTRDEIRGIIEGISDEQLKKILDINSRDVGKAKGSFSELQKAFEDAEAENALIKDKLSGFENAQCEAEKMKNEIDRLQKVIEESEKSREAEKAEADLAKRFGTATEGKEFVNKYTQNGLFAEFRAAVAEEKNTGKSDAEIYSSLIEGRENLFIPDNDVPIAVASTMGFGGAVTDSDVREIMGLPAFK